MCHFTSQKSSHYHLTPVLQPLGTMFISAWSTVTWTEDFFPLWDIMAIKPCSLFTSALIQHAFVSCPVFFNHLLHAFCFSQKFKRAGWISRTNNCHDRQIDGLSDVTPGDEMVILYMSLPKTSSHHPVPPPHTRAPSQRWLMLTTSCSGWVTEWWMSVEGSPPQGPTGKGPHLQRQLRRAGESHRYALFWLGSAASQPAKPPSIRPTIGARRDKITRCVVEKGIGLGSYPSQMFQCMVIRVRLM